MATSQTASFIILCLGDFSSNLCIPRKFMAKYTQVADQVSMMLETDERGRCWDVKIIKKKSRDGDYYMKDGWSEFVKDNNIEERDVMVFRLVGASSFKVTIYGEDCCLRQPPSSPTTTHTKTSSEGGGVMIKRGRREQWSPLYFETRLKKHHKYRVSIPKHFAEAARMKERRQVRVEFVGKNHLRQNVVVDNRPKYRVDLAKGWGLFRKANGLEYDTILYSFEFDPIQNLIYVNEAN